MQRTATHCNTLQLQPTATHWERATGCDGEIKCLVGGEEKNKTARKGKGKNKTARKRKGKNKTARKRKGKGGEE